MKITEIHISHSRTINMGNYESIKPTVSMTATVESGDDVYNTGIELSRQVAEMLNEEIDSMKDHMK